jgi:hypothetical protein
MKMVAGGTPVSSAMLHDQHKEAKGGNLDRGIPYRAAELGSKPNSAKVDETEKPELGT